MKRTGVTIQQVARLSGYSTATVSRVLNKPELVTEDVRQHVLKAAGELGYIGNNAARALRQNSSRQFGAIIPTLNYAIYAGFVEAVQKRFHEEGYTLLLTTSDYSLDTEADLGIQLIRAGIEGLVLVGNYRRDRLQDMLDTAQLPTVGTYVYDPTCPRSTIGIDNQQVFKSSVQYLHDLGHREFGMIAGISKENDRVLTRIAGFQAGLAAYGLDASASRISKEHYTIEAGRKGVRRLFAAHPVTAIICGSDMLALGAMIECRDMGLDVPRDVSIVGLDNLDFAAYVEPGLTSVIIPSSDMGDRAADYLLARCKGAKETVHVRFDAEMIIRGSTGPAPKARRRTR